MSKEIWEYDAVDAGNDFASADGGWSEGMLRRDVDNAARANLGTARRDYNDREWVVVRVQGPDVEDIGVFNRVSATRFTLSLTGVDLSSYFTDGRIVKIVDGVSAGVDLITQVSGNATYSDPLTTVNIKSTDAIQAMATDALTYISSVARGLSLLDAETDFYIPATADDVGIQQAVDDAEAAGGGTVLLIHSLYNLAISVAILGPVTLLGALPKTVFKANDATNLSQMVIILNASANGTQISQVKFDANQANQTTGLGYCVNVATIGTGQLKFEDCEFVNARVGVQLTDVNFDNVQFNRCRFSAFERFAIASAAATNTHRGTLSDCKFDGSGMIETDPAAIKLAGQWSITGCDLEDMGHASLLPRGIWIWNKTGSENGGYQSRVVGNRVECANAANGIGIEVGASECTVTGNVVEMATSTGTGIYLISRTGGQNVDSVSVTGNSVKNGLNGIVTNDLIRNSVISGNTVVKGAAGNCIEDDGTRNLVSGNTVIGGLKGIEIKGNALGSMVSGNSFASATTNAIEITGAADRVDISNNRIDTSGTGIKVSATAVNTYIGNNNGIEATTPIDDSGITTKRWDNTFDAMTLHGFESVNSSSSSETDYPAITGLDMPAGGGVGTYLISVSVVYNSNSATVQSGTVNVYTGTNGTKADTFRIGAVGVDYATSNITRTMTQSALFVAVAADVKWGATYTQSATGGDQGTTDAYVTISKIKV